MRQAALPWFVAALLLWASQAQGVTMTFDDIPAGQGLRYYWETWGVVFSNDFALLDHSSSTWGLPYSGTNVAAPGASPGMGYSFLGLKNDDGPLYASSVGGYFSTAPGAVVRMTAYHIGLVNGDAVASALIGSQGGSWNNKYVRLDYAAGIREMEFEAVTADALVHFCVDDLTINFVPEPSSLLALSAFLAPLAGLAIRRRR